MWSKKKYQFSRFPSFQFCPIPKIKNSEISESFLLLKFLVLNETQNLKTDSKMTKKKKKKLYDVVCEEKKCPFRRFRVFDLILYLKSKVRNLGKFSFTSNCYCFHYISLNFKLTHPMSS